MIQIKVTAPSRNLTYFIRLPPEKAWIDLIFPFKPTHGFTSATVTSLFVFKFCLTFTVW